MGAFTRPTDSPARFRMRQKGSALMDLEVGEAIS